MISIAQICALVVFVVTAKTGSGLKLNASNVRPIFGKTNNIAKSQVAFAQLALSFALVLGLPAVSSGERTSFNHIITLGLCSSGTYV